ncbi:MAG TPA: hypothetical protein VGR07_17740, partial [Thermoanaerobaculia bacterium]|nr:hypothetical protein [Thermoanaerobaculia bacterium]
MRQDDIDFVEHAKAATARHALSLAPLGPKPLRRPKERLPVALELDVQQVFNPDDLPAAPALAPLGPVQPPPVSPIPHVAFDGGADDGTSIPPDTMGAVGDHHLFNPLNNWIRITDRVGNAAAPRMRLDDFWQGLGNPMHTFDPRVVYDPFRQRFLFASTANAE